MRIFSEELKKKLDEISLFLTKEEVLQLRGYLNQLIEDPKQQHFHLSSDDFKKEITLSIYEKSDLSDFDERSKRLILNDE